ncbi:hypothetical protein [Limnohabitans sp. T6-5]|uniref:hypothetical protein n=1 Tax=Limnohabitans sp. T6-5 TaxID=1100724 RepID=UPI0011B1D25B|nr:hypothetical protein [Limnohabitans sp. T6-5]
MAIIEAKIKTLVDTMNGTGDIETVASCEGHWWGGRAPYIYFKSSAKVAQSIERNIRSFCWSEKSDSNFDWVISAQFNEQFDLTFQLHSPLLDRLSESTWKSIWTLGLHRNRIDSDLSTLTKLLNQIELGGGNVPNVIGVSHVHIV